MWRPESTVFLHLPWVSPACNSGSIYWMHVFWLEVVEKNKNNILLQIHFPIPQFWAKKINFFSIIRWESLEMYGHIMQWPWQKWYTMPTLCDLYKNSVVNWTFWPMKLGLPRCLKTLGTSHSVMWHHSQEEQRPQLHDCENVKTCMVFTCFYSSRLGWKT